MPVTSLKELAHAKFTGWGTYGSVYRESSKGEELVRLTAARFDVSRDAARVRLEQLALLTHGVGSASLTLE